MQLHEEAEKTTRKGSPPIKVYCLPGEKQLIAAKANAAGLSLSNYLLTLGLGYEVRSIMDSKAVVQLAKINADQGRLGGLLKLWLSNDERFAGTDEVTMRATVRAVLARIEATQAEMLALVQKIT